jgi:hypothetical protein
VSDAIHSPNSRYTVSSPSKQATYNSPYQIIPYEQSEPPMISFAKLLHIKRRSHTIAVYMEDTWHSLITKHTDTLHPLWANWVYLDNQHMLNCVPVVNKLCLILYSFKNAVFIATRINLELIWIKCDLIARSAVYIEDMFILLKVYKTMHDFLNTFYFHAGHNQSDFYLVKTLNNHSSMNSEHCICN